MADLSPRRTRIANALPHLAQALHRLERALRGGSDRHAAIGVGIHAEAVIDQGDQVDTALDVEDATGMHVLARNLARLIRLFPEWNAFVEAAAPLTAEARAEIRRAMILLIGELDGRDTVDPAVIARLRDLLGAIDDPAASATAWKAAVAGVRTVFIRLAGWLLALGADDRSEVSKKAVAGAAIGTVGTGSAIAWAIFANQTAHLDGLPTHLPASFD